MENFNKLTPAQTERLSKLIEEASEVIQEAAKILAHGYDTRNPVGEPDGPTNREKLEIELGDFSAVLHLMKGAKDVSSVRIVKARRMKFFKLDRWMHHQK